MRRCPGDNIAHIRLHFIHEGFELRIRQVIDKGMISLRHDSLAQHGRCPGPVSIAVVKSVAVSGLLTPGKLARPASEYLSVTGVPCKSGSPGFCHPARTLEKHTVNTSRFIIPMAPSPLKKLVYEYARWQIDDDFPDALFTLKQ